MSKLTIFKHSRGSLEKGEAVKNLESIFWKESAYEDGEFTLKTKDSDLIETLRAGEYISCEVEGVDQSEYDLMVVEKVEVNRDQRGFLDITISGKNASVLWKYVPCLPNIESINKERNELSNFTPKKLMHLAMMRGNEYSEKNGYGIDYTWSGEKFGEIDKNDNKIETYNLGRRTVYDICREISQAYNLSFYGQWDPRSTDELRMVVNYPLDHRHIEFDYNNGDILSEKFLNDRSNVYDNIRVFTPEASMDYDANTVRVDFLTRLGFADHSDFEDEKAKMEAQQQANLEAVIAQRERVEAEGRGYNAAELADIYLRALQNSLYAVGYYYEQKEQAYAKAKELLYARRVDQFYSFEMSYDSENKYLQDYELGSIVSVTTSWGKKLDMIVTSFVRYEEYGMYKEYPELAEYRD